MSTVHNPVNFEPADYEVFDYFDNKPPEYHFGMTAEFLQQERAWFQREQKRIFPDGNCYQCEHCGQSRVRYVVACTHKPTGKRVCFGDVCVHRLGFANQNEFKAAKIRSKAILDNERMFVYQKYLTWIEKNPDAASFLEEAAKPVYSRNTFIQDIAGKLKAYGTVSEKQKLAVLKAMERTVEFANKPPEIKGDAPTGRCEVEGVIVSIKEHESQFGLTLKMTVKLDNNALVWCTVPSGSDAQKRDRVSVKATWTVSDRDKSFAFGKRPVVRTLTRVEVAG